MKSRYKTIEEKIRVGKKGLSRAFKLVLAVMLIIGMMPTVAFAEENVDAPVNEVSASSEQDNAAASGADDAASTTSPVGRIWGELENPLYGGAGEFQKTDLPSADAPSLLSDDVSYVSYDKAAAAVTEAMANREETVTVSLETDENYSSLAESMFYAAFEEDGNPLHGDYLRWIWSTMSCNVSGYVDESTGVYYITYEYALSYYTTFAQEEGLVTAVDDALATMDLDGKSSYEKTKAIYDYICTNVVYDNDHLEDESYGLQYTAYAAMVNGTSVCQGYASLFYLMAGKAGLSARMIAGISNEQNHSWNIVKLDDGYYYNLDATWDSSKKQAGNEYKYFLKSDADFTGHSRGIPDADLHIDYASDEFYAAYPMAETSYSSTMGADEEDFAYTIANDKVTITGYTGNEASLVIPSEIEERSVASIDDAAFMGNERLEKVVVPDSVLSIGSHAFSGCTALSQVNLPANCKLGWFVFSDCAALTDIEIPKGITSSGSSLNTDPLLDAPALKNVTFADGVSSIPNALFARCVSLASVDIPDSVKEIGSSAFGGCVSLSSVKLPASGCKLGRRIFSNCPSLTSIEIPDGLDRMYQGNTTALLSASKLVDVSFAEDVSVIPAGLFRGCASLESIDIPDSVQEIEDYAFGECTALSDVVLPSNCNLSRPFYGCTALTRIEIPNGLTGGLGAPCLVDVSFAEGISVLGGLGGCSSLESVDVPDTVIMLEKYAFGECSSLSSVSLPDSVEVIGENAFSNCASLISIDLPGSIKAIGVFAFSNCTSLVDIVIPDSSVQIAVAAFSSCESLQSVFLPKSVSFIGAGAFEGMSEGSTIVVSTQEQFDLLSDNADYISTDRTTVVLRGSAEGAGYSAEDYVKRLYADILGDAEPTDYQLEYWAGRIGSGRPVASVVRGFLESDAFASKGYSDAEKVAVLYGAMLGNYGPTDYQLSYWTDKMEAGWTLSQVVYGFSRSEAFLSQVDLYGLAPGELDAEDYVMRLYNDVLNVDEPSEYQLSYWAGKISSGTPVAEVVSGLLASDAFKAMGYTNEQKVAVLYGAMLGNYEPTEFQISYWADRFASGTTEYDVCSGFAASAAFAEQAALYGLNV